MLISLAVFLSLTGIRIRGIENCVGSINCKLFICSISNQTFAMKWHRKEWYESWRLQSYCDSVLFYVFTEFAEKVFLFLKESHPCAVIRRKQWKTRVFLYWSFLWSSKACRRILLFVFLTESRYIGVCFSIQQILVEAQRVTFYYEVGSYRDNQLIWTMTRLLHSLNSILVVLVYNYWLYGKILQFAFPYVCVIRCWIEIHRTCIYNNNDNTIPSKNPWASVNSILLKDVIWILK